MFGLLKLINLFVGDDRQRYAEQEEHTSEMRSCVNPANEVELAPEVESQILLEVQSAVKRRLAEPDTAKLDDCSIYTQGIGDCYIVCGRVLSMSVAGTEACNYFLADVDGRGKVVGCELVEADPRGESVGRRR